jgi:hypothetical protein
MLWAGQVGTIGIGEPGDWQFYFAAGFGCEVTAFTTESEEGGGGSKLGAHYVEIQKLAGARPTCDGQSPSRLARSSMT